MNKKLLVFLLVCFLGLIVVYYFPSFSGLITFGIPLDIFFMLFSGPLKWILFCILGIAAILSVIFKAQGRSIGKIWIVSGLIITIFSGVVFFFLVMWAGYLLETF